MNEYIKKLECIDTPVVLIDYQKLIKNIKSIQKIADDNKIELRPHIKTHKCLEIARLQLQEGALGITCAKTEEALVFAKDGVSSITVAYPVIEEHKLIRLISTCQQLLSNCCQAHKNKGFYEKKPLSGLGKNKITNLKLTDRIFVL